MSAPDSPSNGDVWLQGANFGRPPVVIEGGQMQRLLPLGAVVVDDSGRSGSRAGVTITSSGELVLTKPGRFCIAAPPMEQPGGKSTMRTAQYLCGLTGAILVNMVFLSDPAGRSANAKDFTINFASDILAVGVVLLMAELVDKWKAGRARRQQGDGEAGHMVGQPEHFNVYDRPMAVAGLGED